MSEQHVIAVIGATGAQGGGLVRAITRDQGSRFTARAITRDPDSEAAKALADLGAEVVAGYWENFIYFGLGPQRGADGTLTLTFPMGDKRLPGMGLGRHRPLRLWHLHAPSGGDRHDGVGDRREPDRRRAGAITDERARGDGPLERRQPRRLPQLRLPRGRRIRQHVPLQARFRSRLGRRPRSPAQPLAQPGAPHLRRLAHHQRQAHSIGLGHRNDRARDEAPRRR
jgi:hypothetical protein